jgi:hypothetical protein
VQLLAMNDARRLELRSELLARGGPGLTGLADASPCGVSSRKSVTVRKKYCGSRKTLQRGPQRRHLAVFRNREARLQVGAERFCVGNGPAHNRRFVVTLLPRDGPSESPDLRRSPSVTMMQPAQHRNRYDPARLRRLDQPWLWTVFLQCQVRAIPMIIFQKCLKVPVQASLVEDDHVIQAFAGESHGY